MSEQKKSGKPQGKALENFLIGLGKIILGILRVSGHGLNRTIIRNVDRCLALGVFYSSIHCCPVHFIG